MALGGRPLAGRLVLASDGLWKYAPERDIADIGSSILVNSAYLQPPYDVSVIGPPELYDRLTTSPSFVELVRARVQGYGLELGFLPSDHVVVPAFAGAVKLVYGGPVASTPPGGQLPAGGGAGATPTND